MRSATGLLLCVLAALAFAQEEETTPTDLGVQLQCPNADLYTDGGATTLLTLCDKKPLKVVVNKPPAADTEATIVLKVSPTCSGDENDIALNNQASFTLTAATDVKPTKELTVDITDFSLPCGPVCMRVEVTTTDATASGSDFISLVKPCTEDDKVSDLAVTITGTDIDPANLPSLSAGLDAAGEYKTIGDALDEVNTNGDIAIKVSTSKALNRHLYMPLTLSVLFRRFPWTHQEAVDSMNNVDCEKKDEVKEEGEEVVKERKRRSIEQRFKRSASATAKYSKVANTKSIFRHKRQTDEQPSLEQMSPEDLEKLMGTIKDKEGLTDEEVEKVLSGMSDDQKMEYWEMMDEAKDEKEMGGHVDLMSSWYEEWIHEFNPYEGANLPRCFNNIYESMDTLLAGGLITIPKDKLSTDGDEFDITEDIRKIKIKADQGSLCMLKEKDKDTVEGELLMIIDPLGIVQDADADICSNALRFNLSIDCSGFDYKDTADSVCMLNVDPTTNSQRVEIDFGAGQTLGYSDNSFYPYNGYEIEGCFSFEKRVDRTIFKRSQLLAKYINSLESDTCEDLGQFESKLADAVLTAAAKRMTEAAAEAAADNQQTPTRKKRQTDLSEIEQTIIDRAENLKDLDEDELKEEFCYYKQIMEMKEKIDDLVAEQSDLTNAAGKIDALMKEAATLREAADLPPIECDKVTVVEKDGGKEYNDHQSIIEELTALLENVENKIPESVRTIVQYALQHIMADKLTGSSSGNEKLKVEAAYFRGDTPVCPRSQPRTRAGLISDIDKVIDILHRVRNLDAAVSDKFIESAKDHAKCGGRRVQQLYNLKLGNLMNRNIRSLRSDFPLDDTVLYIYGVLYFDAVRAALEDKDAPEDILKIKDLVKATMDQYRDTAILQCNAEPENPSDVHLPGYWFQSNGVIYHGINNLVKDVPLSGEVQNLLWKPMLMCRCDSCVADYDDVYEKRPDDSKETGDETKPVDGANPDDGKDTTDEQNPIGDKVQ